MQKMQKKTKKTGFTLLEILIVLAIVAVLSTVTVLKVTAPSYSKFTAVAQKVASTLEIIGDQAVYSNSVIICDLKDGFSCQSYKNGEWNTLQLSKILSWQWPDSIEVLQVYVGGNKLQSDWKVRFLPMGNLNPISIQITDGHYTTWIDQDMSGDFKVSN